MVIIPIDADQLSTMMLNAARQALKEAQTNEGAAKPGTTSRPPLNVQQTAKYLDLAVPTIYALVGRKEINHFKKSGKLYFREEDLDRWLASGRQSTTSEIAADAIASLPSLKKREGGRNA